MDRSHIIATHEEEIDAVVAQLAAADATAKRRAEAAGRERVILEEARRRLAIDQQIATEEAAFADRLEALRAQRAGGASGPTPTAPATPTKAAGGGGGASAAAAEAPGAPKKKLSKKQARWHLFVAFVHEQLQKVHPRARYSEAMKAAGARWDDGKPSSEVDQQAFAQWQEAILLEAEEEAPVAGGAAAAAPAAAEPSTVYERHHQEALKRSQGSAFAAWMTDPLLPELIKEIEDAAANHHYNYYTSACVPLGMTGTVSHGMFVDPLLKILKCQPATPSLVDGLLAGITRRVKDLGFEAACTGAVAGPELKKCKIIMAAANWAAELNRIIASGGRMFLFC
jgi:hypothetical protein